MARNAIAHGDPIWDPMFGANRHDSHYRIATELFPLVLDAHLERLTKKQAEFAELTRGFRVGPVERLLTSNKELIDRFTELDFGA